MAEATAARGNPLFALLVFIIVVAAFVVGWLAIGPAILWTIGLVSTFLMFIALIVVTMS